jgi:hypothetical protein
MNNKMPINTGFVMTACYSLGMSEPISVEPDGTVWLGVDPDRVYPDMAPIWEEYYRLLAQEPHNQVEAARLYAYEQTSDPIFFKWQRGDATEAEWREAVAKVKADNPYPPAP